MRKALKENDVVRIVKLIEPLREFSGTEGVLRAPRIADEGTVVGYFPPALTVEMVDEDGVTVWLADFVSEELELVWTPPPQRNSI